MGIFTASIASPAIAGDYNEDHVVNAADYTVWRNHLGTPAGSLPNDPDGGVIGLAQYETWKASYGQMASGGGSASVNEAVPEPTNLLLLMEATVACLMPTTHAAGVRRFADVQDC